MKMNGWKCLTEAQKYASYIRRCKKKGIPVKPIEAWRISHQKYSDAYHRKPMVEKAKQTGGTEKNCLGCGNKFISAHKFNRMCHYCNQKS
jgi:hypothetical protein